MDFSLLATVNWQPHLSLVPAHKLALVNPTDYGMQTALSQTLEASSKPLALTQTVKMKLWLVKALSNVYTKLALALSFAKLEPELAQVLLESAHTALPTSLHKVSIQNVSLKVVFVVSFSPFSLYSSLSYYLVMHK